MFIDNNDGNGESAVFYFALMYCLQTVPLVLMKQLWLISVSLYVARMPVRFIAEVNKCQKRHRDYIFRKSVL